MNAIDIKENIETSVAGVYVIRGNFACISIEACRRCCLESLRSTSNIGFH